MQHGDGGHDKHTGALLLTQQRHQTQVLVLKTWKWRGMLLSCSFHLPFYIPAFLSCFLFPGLAVFFGSLFDRFCFLLSAFCVVLVVFYMANVRWPTLLLTIRNAIVFVVSVGKHYILTPLQWPNIRK